MRILLGISALVLVAILWCMVAIMQHVRLARRRARLLREQRELGARSASLWASPSVEQVAPLPTRFATADACDKPTPQPQPQEKPLHAAPPPASLTQATQAQTPPLTRALPPLPNREVPRQRPAAIPVVAAASHAPLRILEFVPNASSSESNAPSQSFADVFPAAPMFPDLQPTTHKRATRVMAVAAPPVVAMPPTADADPGQRRPVRSAPPPTSSEVRPANRPDWIYFNKDMGDLSDPAPSRVRDRVRAR
jgi:hypothetical protein